MNSHHFFVRVISSEPCLLKTLKRRLVKQPPLKLELELGCAQMLMRIDWQAFAADLVALVLARFWAIRLNRAPH